MSWKKVALVCLGVGASIWMAGCGGSAPSVGVSVTAAASTVDGSDTTTLSATVSNDQNSAGVTWTVSGGGTLSSTTTTGATYTAPAPSANALVATVTATSVADKTKSASATVAVPAQPAISTTALSANVGTAFSSTLAATGGIAPYTWSLTQGTLPTGWAVSTAGVVSGPAPVAAEAGAVNLTFAITDSGTATALTATQQVVLTISPAPAITFTGTVAATATYNVAFTGSAAATGGASTLTYSVLSGSLPGGLTLNTATGAITGTPNAAGTFPFSIQAADAYGDSASKAYSVVVSYPALTITTAATLPPAVINTAYAQTLAATGGSGGYSWSTNGAGTASLAAVNLTLSAAGLVSGTPLAAGTATFAATVSDSTSHTATVTFSVTASHALAITTSSLTPLNVGQAPTQVLSAAGGSGITADYSWSWTAAGGSSLPPGLTMGATGVLGGSPTTAGTYNVVVKVQDSGSGTSATATLSITINAALALPANSTLPVGYTGVAYNGVIAATGGSGNYCYKVPTAAQYAAGIWDGLQTALPNSSSGACNYIGSSLSISGTPTNPPAPPYSISFTIPVTDLTTGQTISQLYVISVTAPIAPSLPASNLTAATVGQSYNGSIAATGGVGPNYTWTINGTVLATNGSPVSVGDGLSVSNNGSNALSISGSPSSVSTSPGVQFTAQVKDNTTGLTSGTAATYTIVVNSAGSQVSGQISLANNCGVSTLPTFSVSINTTPVQTTTTDNNGNYSFASVPNGTYTITPSIIGAESVFSPTALPGIVINNSSAGAKNFTASVGYTVSGNVAYAGARTGPVYLVLNNNGCGGNNQPGTGISNSTLTSGGAFTVRGVAPGSYTLQAWMDTFGQGASNATDPAGTASVTVSTANLTGAAVTLTDPTVATPGAGPSFDAVSPMNLGVAISFGPIKNSSGVEAVSSYMVEWSTSSSFTSPGSYTFAAIGTKTNVWILNNGLSGITGSLANGTAYYFRARGQLSNGTVFSPWTVYGGSTPTAVTVGEPSGAGYYTVSGTATLPSSPSPTGPLYVGFFDQSTGKVYATSIPSPSTTTANSYTVSVPSTTATYYFFGILDQNNDGLIDTGDVSNTGDSGNNVSNNVTISGNMTGVNETLNATSSTIAATTEYYQTSYSGGSSSGYSINVNIRLGYKLPLSVALTAASNPNMILPVDIAICGSNCGNPQWQFNAPVGGTPHVGDTYTFSVTYSDGTTGNLIGTLTAWNGTSALVGASDLATNLAPTANSSTNLMPNFTWTDPANVTGLTYQFYLSSSNGTVWTIPGNNSNLNGFPSTVTQIIWGTDPTGDTGNTPSVGSLTPGTTYYWQLNAQDSNGNSALNATYYIP